MSENSQASEGRGGDDGSQHRYLAPPRTVVGKMMREDREARGLKQVEAAEALGFSQSKLSAYERGSVRQPPPNRLVAMAKLYGRPDDFYLNQLGWSNGAKLVAQVPPEGALVIAQPRAGLAELIGVVEQLDDADFAHLIDTAQFLIHEPQKRDG